MKKILLLFLSLMLVLGITNIALAHDKPIKMEAIEEEIVIEETENEDTVEVETVKDKTSCSHTWGEWCYDLIEHEDGSITYFRSCDCGAYEELSERAFLDLGGQYEDCSKGRHYWCDEDGIRFCEECGYSEEVEQMFLDFCEQITNLP